MLASPVRRHAFGPIVVPSFAGPDARQLRCRQSLDLRQAFHQRSLYDRGLTFFLACGWSVWVIFCRRRRRRRRLQTV